jgi:peptidyl-prolyl cis-trans isomerase C
MKVTNEKVLLVHLALLFFGCSKRMMARPLPPSTATRVTLEEFNKSRPLPANMKMLVLNEAEASFLDRMSLKDSLRGQEENIEKEKDFEDKLTEIREQLLIESLLKKKVIMNINTTEEELKKYYEANKEKFKKGPEIETRQIVVRTEKEAKEIKARLTRGRFCRAGQNYSIDPSAKTTGGSIGFHGKGSLLPEYEAAAFKLTKTGQISQPVKTQLGYIIQLQGTKEAVHTV